MSSNKPPLLETVGVSYPLHTEVFPLPIPNGRIVNAEPFAELVGLE